MDILVSLGAATLCFLGQCYPALVGEKTSVGTHPIIHLYTDDPGYGGDVLKYDENATTVFAIHRVWTLKPEQRRRQRLKSTIISERQGVTNGCINIDELVYDKLVEACKYGCKLTIQH